MGYMVVIVDQRVSFKGSCVALWGPKRFLGGHVRPIKGHISHEGTIMAHRVQKNANVSP